MEDNKHVLPFKGQDIEDALRDLMNGFVLSESPEEFRKGILAEAEAKDAAQLAAIQEEIKKEVDRSVAEEAKIREEFVAADNALKLALQAEIDADVQLEIDRAIAEEALIREEVVAEVEALQAEIDADVKVEADRAVAEEAKIREEFVAADEVLKEEMQGIVDQIKEKVGDPAACEDDGTDIPASGLFARVDALEDIDHEKFVAKEDGKSLVLNELIDKIHDEEHVHDDLAAKADVDAALLEKATKDELADLITRIDEFEAEFERRIKALEDLIVKIPMANIDGLQAALADKADDSRCDNLNTFYTENKNAIADIKNHLGLQ